MHLPVLRHGVRLLAWSTLALVQLCNAAGVLPPEVAGALERAKLPPQALVAVVQEVGADAPPRLAWQPDLPVNPASLTKLFTTFAGLELLGPAWTWTTPVWLQGRVQDGVLDGNLVIKGSGDPKLVLERLWLMLRRVQQLGVREIRGDIVLDRSAFVVPDRDPGDFDGEPLRPYNATADALLLNFKSVVLTFTPDAARGVAVVSVDPPLAGVRVDASVPLRAVPCDDWRGALKADFADPARIAFAGVLPIACGERTWPVAYADPKRYAERALAGLWKEMGGMLTGSVHDGIAPTTPPTFALTSPPLADVVRDINKYSNNLMAQQLFLTLGLTQRGAGTPDAARDVLQAWMSLALGPAANGVVIDNGSGLSRDTRISAAAFARLLQVAWASPVMPELMSSLPVAGLDGTLKRSRATLGHAHLKTGSLRDVNGVAGYVLAGSGRRYVVVGIVSHPNAGAARPALDALAAWAADDAQRQKR
ncbi:MAG: D-alanyl-D-alanine carboxypeptidase/D-alanyl-D-alanine-endopeptidase [Proteobacteria bacterium]|nr:D-alanyl-D-alanine carboxypeptidase/D-alanyl-D-alanine-endopeptidase [Pseudomonadota bacterium]